MNITTDPEAPHRATEPHSPLETALMQAALDDTSDSENRGHRLNDLIPDVHEMAHRAGGLRPDIKDAVERITGNPCQGAALPLGGGHAAPNPAAARSALKRWAIRWHGYMRS